MRQYLQADAFLKVACGFVVSRDVAVADRPGCETSNAICSEYTLFLIADQFQHVLMG